MVSPLIVRATTLMRRPPFLSHTDTVLALSSGIALLTPLVARAMSMHGCASDAHAQQSRSVQPDVPKHNIMSEMDETMVRWSGQQRRLALQAQLLLLQQERLAIVRMEMAGGRVPFPNPPLRRAPSLDTVGDG
jgi:hypothetical protein